MDRVRTDGRRTGSPKRRLRYLAALLTAVFAVGLFIGAQTAQAKYVRYTADTSGMITNEETVYYEAKISVRSVANVRTGPGTSSDRLSVNGEFVQLTNGHDVLIIGEATNTDNELWYQIRFEFAGQEVEGYCRSDFMMKTGGTITPSPTPSPSPSPTPTPKPTEAPDDEPTKAPTKSPTKPLTTQGNGGSTGQAKKPGSMTRILLIVFLILFILAAAYIAYYFLVFKKQKEEQRLRQKQQNGKPVAHKRTGENGEAGRAMRPESGGPGRTTGQVKPVQPGSRHTGTRPTNGQVRRPAGAAKPQTGTVLGARPTEKAPQGISTGSMQMAKPAGTPVQEKPVMKENELKDVMGIKPQENAMEDRSALREEINNLEAGDYVMHKYLGIGQVYDNSDVKLIEIRFGSDMRFLNKESCIMKKILRKCREDEI